MNREIKYRQRVNNRWHYWGFNVQFEGAFTGPSNPTDPSYQFTGLKDCNGVEIYEGDIVEDEEHYYSVISWDNDDSMYVASDVGPLADIGSQFKVIGNIYEHPELLEQQQ